MFSYDFTQNKIFKVRIYKNLFHKQIGQLYVSKAVFKIEFMFFFECFCFQQVLFIVSNLADFCKTLFNKSRGFPPTKSVANFSRPNDKIANLSRVNCQA